MKPAEEYVHRRARCRDCWNAYRRDWFHRAGSAQQSDRNRSYTIQQRQQESTLQQASRAGLPWDQEQDRVILDNWDEPLREVAVTLNRTYQSIVNRKKKLKQCGLTPGKDDPA